MNDIHSLNTGHLQAIDSQFHIHPFTDSKHLHSVGSRIITDADGIYVWDSDGNKIIDGMAGLWCVNLGYGRDELVDAATVQLRKLPYYNTFFMTSHPPVIELSRRLAEVTPPQFNHVFLTNSGSEANDTVLRMVRRYWAIQGKSTKTVVISRINAYHGSTYGAASLGGMAYMHEAGIPIPGIEHIPQPYWYRDGGELDPDTFGLRVARRLEQKIEQLGVDNVAAFIAEPIQGAGGVIVPPQSYWQEISRICDTYEILFVADEVICGFGRTGKWFATDTFSLNPDLMVIAKGLSSGYLPIGGVMLSDKVASVMIESGGEFTHGFTYSGHPAACAVASENIRILRDENVVDRVETQIGPYFQAKLRELEDHPLVGEVRGVGLIAGIELVKDKISRTSFDTDLKIGIRCRNHAARLGLIMRAIEDSMVLSPPLIISKTQVDDLVSIAAEALDATQRSLST